MENGWIQRRLFQLNRRRRHWSLESIDSRIVLIELFLLLVQFSLEASPFSVHQRTHWAKLTNFCRRFVLIVFMGKKAKIDERRIRCTASQSKTKARRKQCQNRRRPISVVLFPSASSDITSHFHCVHISYSTCTVRSSLYHGSNEGSSSTRLTARQAVEIALPAHLLS